MKETRVVIEVDLVKIIFLGVLFGVLAALAMGRARAENVIPCPDIRATLATVRSNNPKMTETQAVEYLAALARSAGV
jgi:hypothetical protein